MPSDRPARAGLPGRRRRPAAGERGFTLLEVMLAIVIFGVVMTIIYQSFQQSMASAEILRRKRDLYEVGRLAMDRIREDLTEAVIFPTDARTRFVGLDDKDAEGNPLHTLGFTSLAHVRFNPVAAESDLCEVAYGYHVDSETGVRTLVRREDPTLDEDPTSGGIAYPLVEGVKSLALSYYDGDEWLERWSTEELAQAAAAKQAAAPGAAQVAGPLEAPLPLAVEVKLVLEDPSGEEAAFADLVRLPLAKAPAAGAGAAGSAQEAGSEEEDEDDEDEDEDLE